MGKYRTKIKLVSIHCRNLVLDAEQLLKILGKGLEALLSESNL